jgi:TolB-like protein
MRLDPKIVTALLCLPFLLSCSSLPFWREKPLDIPEWLREGDIPKKVAVLPFENLTGDPELQELVRRSFYSHFALKKYRDIELSEVDRALEILQADSLRQWRDLPPQVLGNLFQADFLIYGKVMEYSKLFAGIYSQVSLKVQVEMVECRSGSGVWWKTAVKRSHEGGVPFSLFGVIPEAVRSGFHMTKERTLDLVERLNREIVADIPDPPLAESSPYFLDVQVASFLEMELALKSQEELRAKEHNARIEPVKMGDRTYHRVLMGPYRTAEEAEKAKSSLGKAGYKPILIHHRPERMK